MCINSSKYRLWSRVDNNCKHFSFCFQSLNNVCCRNGWKFFIIDGYVFIGNFLLRKRGWLFYVSFAQKKKKKERYDEYEQPKFNSVQYVIIYVRKIENCLHKISSWNARFILFSDSIDNNVIKRWIGTIYSHLDECQIHFYHFHSTWMCRISRVKVQLVWIHIEYIVCLLSVILAVWAT